MVCALLRDPELCHEEVPLGSLKSTESRWMIFCLNEAGHIKDKTYLGNINESIIGKEGHEGFRKEITL